MRKPMWPKRRARLRALDRVIGPLGPERCLNLGCSDGRIGRSLEGLGGRWLHAEVQHPHAATVSRGLRGFVVEVGMPLPFADGAFDVIVASDVLEHVPDDRALAAEAVRCLKPDGRLIVTAPLQRRGLLDRVAKALGLTDAHFGHCRPGYTMDGLLSLLRPRPATREAGGPQHPQTSLGVAPDSLCRWRRARKCENARAGLLAVESLPTLGGPVEEMLELVANAVYAWTEDRAGHPRRATPTADDWRGWRGFVGRVTGMIVRVISVVDCLPGMSVRAEAVICARKTGAAGLHRTHERRMTTPDDAMADPSPPRGEGRVRGAARP